MNNGSEGAANVAPPVIESAQGQNGKNLDTSDAKMEVEAMAFVDESKGTDRMTADGNVSKAGRMKHPKQKTRAQAKKEREQAFVPEEEPTEGDLEAAARVLAYYSQNKDFCDKLRQLQSKSARVVRASAVKYADQLKGFYFGGLTQEEISNKRKKEFARRMRLAREARMRELDQLHMNKAVMRAVRIETLNQLSYREDSDILTLASGSNDGLLGYDVDDQDDEDEDAHCAPDSGVREIGKKHIHDNTSNEKNENVKRACVTLPTVSDSVDSANSGALVEDVANQVVSKGYAEKEPKSIRIGNRKIMESAKDSTLADAIKTISSTKLVDHSEQLSEALGDVYYEVRASLGHSKASDKSQGKQFTNMADVECKQSSTEENNDAANAGAAAKLASSGGVHAEEDIFDETDDKDLGPTLFAPRSCYTCHKMYDRLHKFYAELCPTCARLNWKKRHQVADLSGHTILLTGSRVKIGFECGLRLLRCGATVIATSRFPHDTAQRYAQLPDYEQWKDRLHVYGLDLRDLKTVIDFCDMICSKHTSLEGIINNAAQTIRRPIYYYQHLLEDELKRVDDLPENYRDIIKGDAHSQYHFGRGLASTEAMTFALSSSETVKIEDLKDDEGNQNPANQHESSVTVEEVEIDDADKSKASYRNVTNDPVVSTVPTISEPSIIAPVMNHGSASVPSLRMIVEAMEQQARERMLSETGSAANNAATLSQLLVTREDHDAAIAKFFPIGLRDVTGQQLDLRPKNSWTLKLKDIDAGELVETFAINALAPFIINSRLFKLMNQNDGKARFVINVSAMEGKFYRNKQSTHPHTNMAKAALNMMTRTSAQDYARYGIYMNSVDTGWINDENPFIKQMEKVKTKDFQTPIDEVDAMARILDPIFDGVNTKEPIWGRFLKDYRSTEW